MQLFPYQTEGANFLATKKRALLADEPGLGKTAQAIIACRDLGVPYLLVICPASVVENWKREIERWWPRQQQPWNVISYDRYSRDHGKVDWMGSGGALILDEAHYLKTRTAKRTKAIFGEKCDGIAGAVERATYVFCLTGTPAPNNPSELWPMLRAVMPDAITPRDVENNPAGKPMNYWQFVQRYCVTRDNGFGIEIVKGKNLDKLRERIAPFMLRRKKVDVLKDLPPIRFDTLPISAAYVESSIRNAEVEPEVRRIADALEKGESLETLAPHVASYRRLVGLAKVQPVAEWCKEWFESGGGKLVLFAYHRDVIHRMYDRLYGFNPSCVWGSLSAAERQAEVDNFQNNPECKVFIGQITAAGTGITLTASSDLVFVECSWVPTDNQQAAMRIHRIGQQNACTVRVASLAGSLDERIQAACMRKLNDIRKVFG